MDIFIIIFLLMEFVLANPCSCRPSMNPRVKNNNIFPRHIKLFVRAHNDALEICLCKI
jgi:hypothetical protein